MNGSVVLYLGKRWERRCPTSNIDTQGRYLGHLEDSKDALEQLKEKGACRNRIFRSKNKNRR